MTIDPNQLSKDILIESSKEIVDQVVGPLYNDVVHPPAQETGNALANLIHGITARLQRHAMVHDFKTALLAKELEFKLQNYDPEKLVSPEDYVLIPAVQAYSYSIDCNELRNLYANLLARSIHSDEKQHVHPAFIEIIKQLSPADCLVFNEVMLATGEVPVIDFSESIDPNNKVDAIPITKNIMCLTSVSIEQAKYAVDNLSRLNLLTKTDAKITNDTAYKPIYESEYCHFLEKQYSTKLVAYEKAIEQTEFGKLFFSVCVVDPA